MAVKPLPSFDTLHQLLSYDPLTGQLTHKHRSSCWFYDSKRQSAAQEAKRWNGRYAGRPAMSYIGNTGYRTGPILGINYQAHRIIFVMMTGRCPDVIDHKNGIRSDNRWKNLEASSDSRNMKNQRRRRTNTSGINGVYHDATRNKWVARLRADYKYIWLGRFDTKEDAILAREEANKRYGFSARHGT